MTATSTQHRQRSVATVVVTIIGALAIIGALGNGALNGLSAALAQSNTSNVSVDDVRRLRLDTNRTQVDVEFAPVKQARLEVDQSGLALGSWVFTVDGSDLLVRSPQSSFGVFSRGLAIDATVVLPLQLAGHLDLDADVNASDVRIDGQFSDVSLNLNAGRLDYTGDARSMNVDVNAGKADVAAVDTERIDLTTQAGSITSSFTGTVPHSTTADVSVGSISLAVPEADYAVSNSGVLGNTTSNVRIRHDPASDHALNVSASLGDVSVTYS